MSGYNTVEHLPILLFLSGWI